MDNSMQHQDIDANSSSRASSRPDGISRTPSRPLLFERKHSEYSRLRGDGPLSPGSPNTPRSPHTPFLGRSLSAYNSPGANFRVDDEAFVFEFGSRFVRAGISGEKSPRSETDFGPSVGRRAGDYRQWLGDSDGSHHPDAADARELWGKSHELWSMNLRGSDLGLIGDRIQKLVQESIRNSILVIDDSRKRRYIVALPSIFPHALLNVLLTTLFHLHPPPQSVTLLPSPVLCAVSAGLRTALVVDVGWNETTVTALYEYREVLQRRSCRGVRCLTWEMKEMLKSSLLFHMTGEEDDMPDLSYEEVEDIVVRHCWCQSLEDFSDAAHLTSADATVTVALSDFNSPQTLEIPSSSFSVPVEQAFFETQTAQFYDNHDLPLPQLIYESLLSLSADVRQECMPRLIITGGGGNIPGIKIRLLQELRKIIVSRGWDPVRNWGRTAASHKKPTVNTPQHAKRASQQTDMDEALPVNKDFDDESTTPAGLQPTLPDPILVAIKARSEHAPSPSSAPMPALAAESNRNSLTESFAEASLSGGEANKAELRLVKSLGPWAGASLISGLRIRGLVEVDRDQFLSHGLAGADREKRTSRHSVEHGINGSSTNNPQAHVHAAAQRQSLAGPAGGAGMGLLGRNTEREGGSSWTLGVWA